MKFNYLFKILSAFLVISGLYSCNVDEEDTNEEFSFTVIDTDIQHRITDTADYELTISAEGLHLEGIFGSDTLIFSLQATQDLPIIIGEYEFSENDFYSITHLTDSSRAFGILGSIDFSEVSKRISADFFNVWVVDPVLGKGYSIEGKIRNLIVTQPLNNPDSDPSDPNAPFNIDYIAERQDGISANINVFPYIAPIENCIGEISENEIKVEGLDTLGNKITITIYDVTNTFVGKTYNVISDLDFDDSKASIHYENEDTQFKSSSGKAYVKSIDEENKVTIVFKCLLQDVNDPTNLFIVDDGAVKNVQLNE